MSDKKEYVMYFEGKANKDNTDVFPVYFGNETMLIYGKPIPVLTNNPLNAIKFENINKLFELYIQCVNYFDLDEVRRRYDFDYYLSSPKTEQLDRIRWVPEMYKSLIFEFETRRGELLYLNISSFSNINNIYTPRPDMMLRKLTYDTVLTDDRRFDFYDYYADFTTNILKLLTTTYNDTLINQLMFFGAIPTPNSQPDPDLIVFSRVYRFLTEDKDKCINYLNTKSYLHYPEKYKNSTVVFDIDNIE